MRVALVVTIVCVATLVAGRRKVNFTQTKTPPRFGGFLSLARDSFSSLEFTNPNLYPQPVLQLVMQNNTFELDWHPECRRLLATASVEGQPWETSFLATTEDRMYPVYQLIQVVVPGVGGESSRTVTKPEPQPHQVNLKIVGFDSFASKAVSASYDFEVPAVCTGNGASPNPVTFYIKKDQRSSIGRAMTYIHFCAAALALVNSLFGSLTSLMLLQQFALVNRLGCLPLKLQEEGQTESFTVTPVQFVVSMLPSPLVSVITGMGLIVVGWLLELVHLCVAGTKRTDPDSTAKLQPQAKPSYYALVPYFGISVTNALIPGVLYNSIQLILFGDSRWLQLIGTAGAALVGLLPILGALGVSRMKSFTFVPYIRSSKGSIPRWLQPEGVWGPNELRLRLGILCEDFRRGYRVFGPMLMFEQLVVVLAAASMPASESSCRNALWCGLIANLASLLVIAYARPFRSKFMNTGFSLLLLLMTLYHGALTYYGGYEHQELSWSFDAIFLIGILFNTCHLIYSLGIGFVLFWELRNHSASNHVDANINPEASAKLQTTQDIIAHMEELFSKSETENKASEVYRRQVVPLSEDDTAGVRFFLEAPRRAGEPEPPLTLADYLLQDVDRLPFATKAQFQLEQQLALERERNQRLVSELSLHPSVRIHHRNNPNYVEPRSKPLDVVTYVPHRERPIPECFGLGQNQSRSPSTNVDL